MKKIFSLLTLLVFVCSGAWADLTPTVVVENDFSSTGPLFANKSRGSVEHNVADQNVKFVSANNTTNGYGNSTYSFADLTKGASAVRVEFDYWIANSACNYDVAFIIRDASVAAGHAKQAMGSAGAFISIGRTRQSSANFFSINHGKTASASASNLGLWTHVNVYVDYATKKLDYSISALGGDVIKEATGVDYYSSSASNVSEIDFFFCVNDETDYLDNLKITKYEDNTASPTTYTVNFRDSNGNTIKDSKTYDTTSGLEYTGNSDDLASFIDTNSGKKYVYSSGNETKIASKTASENVINLVFSEAPSYTYSVSDNLGNTLASGSVYEGDNVGYFVPYFVLKDGKFYKTPSVSAGSLSYGQGTISNIAANTNITVTYTQEANSNVAFYSEAENLTGVTPYTDGYTNIRMSNGAVGYYAASTPFVTLQPGVYTLTASTRSGSTTFYAEAVSENNVILTLSSSGSVVTSTSEEFIIDKPTDILTSVGGTKAYFDYVIIRKTAEYVASESIAINEAALEIGKSTTLTATVTPSNATRKTVYWAIGGMKAKGVKGTLEPMEEEYGEAEINAETGVITPIKAGWIDVHASNGEYGISKQLYISPAEFAVAIEDAPSEAIVYVGDNQSEGATVKVTTKEDFDNMKSTSLLNPEGSISATRIPNYIYDITFDKAKKSIVVVYQEDIAVTAMAFTPAAQRIATGNARTFKVTYSPANASFKTATWVSSDPSVATVSGEGFITALKEGVTTITATWTENDSHHTNFSAQMTLTVDKGLVIDRIVYDQMEDGTAEVMGYYHPMDGDTLFLPAKIFSNGAMIPVSFIKQEAFIGSNLKSIVVPGTVKIIDHRALMYSNTHNAYNENPEEGLESAFLMEGVEVMRDRIFHGNKYMTKVFLPSTLTDIGYYSFYGTDIKDVYFGGTEEQWNALKNLSDSKLPETAKIHFGCNLPSVFVNAITVAEEYVELDAEEIFDLDAQIAPAYFANETDLTYTSSNEAVATVDENGVITAVADGTAIITVSAQSGVEVKVKVQVGEVVRDFTTPLMTTWSVQGGANPEGIFVDAEEHYYNNWGTGTSWFAQAYAQFDLSNLLPTDDFKATFTVWVNCARGTRTFDVYGLEAGTKVADCQELTGKKGVELATYSDITTTYVAKEIDATAYIKSVLEAGGTDAIFIMSNGAAGGNIYGKGSAEFAPTLTIIPANAEGGQTTGIDAAKAAKKISFGKYLNNKGQIIIVKDGNEYNALGVQQK